MLRRRPEITRKEKEKGRRKVVRLRKHGRSRSSCLSLSDLSEVNAVTNMVSLPALAVNGPALNHQSNHRSPVGLSRGCRARTVDSGGAAATARGCGGGGPGGLVAGGLTAASKAAAHVPRIAAATSAAAPHATQLRGGAVPRAAAAPPSCAAASQLPRGACQKPDMPWRTRARRDGSVQVVAEGLPTWTKQAEARRCRGRGSGRTALRMRGVSGGARGWLWRQRHGPCHHAPGLGPVLYGRVIT
jgi:hypothetical protein